MSSNGERIPLPELVQFQRGFDLPADRRQDGTAPVVSSAGVVGTHVEAKVEGPGVVIGRSGSIGGGQFIKEDFWPLNTTLWVKDFRGNDPLWVYYLLLTIDFSSLNAGSGVPTLNRNHLDAIQVWRPPVDTQRAAAAILRAIDDRIESNRRLAVVAEEFTAALFSSWFHAFAPIHAISEGRSPSGVSADQLSAFPGSFSDSGGNPMPSGWKMGRLDDVAEVVMGQSPPSSSYNEEGRGLPLVQGAADLGEIFPTPTRYCDAASRRASAGDLLMTVRAPVGRLNISRGELCLGRGVAGIRSPWRAYVRRLLAAASWSEFESGTIFPAVNAAQVRGLPIVLPPEAVRNAFEETCGPFDSLITQSVVETERLHAIRGLLLRPLITGTMPVSTEASLP